MIDREIEGRPAADDPPANDIATLSYSSLALGLLSGTIGPDRIFAGDDQRKDNPRFSVATARRWRSSPTPSGRLPNNTAPSIAQIVIAWTLAQPGITFALCGARNPDTGARQCAGRRRSRLEAGELAAIDAAIAAHLTDMDA